MYETYVTFLILPHEYQELSSGDWNWDREKNTKAQGLKASLSSFQMITVFVTTKNVLDEVKIIASKLQKHEQDIFEAYEMVGTVIESIESTRKNIDTIFCSWYDEVKLWPKMLV